MSEVTSLGQYSDACREASELIEVTDELSVKIREALSGDFTPIGHVALGSPDFIIPVGVKVRGFPYEQRVAREMSIADQLLSYKSERLNSLPTFTLLIRDDDGTPRGILTEDFTSAGDKSLHEVYERFHPMRIERRAVPEGLRLDVYDALDGKVYPEAFGHTMGYIGHHEVLVDFDDIAYDSKEHLKPYEELANKIAITIADE